VTLSLSVPVRRGFDYEVLEKGVLVNSLFNFPPRMVFFTMPEPLEIGSLPRGSRSSNGPQYPKLQPRENSADFL
jgi:hypothetical protein